MSMMQRSESPTLVPSEALRIEDAALRAVAYADVFDYPLRATEIHRYLHGVVATPEGTAIALAGCGAPGAALRFREGFYTLAGGGGRGAAGRPPPARAGRPPRPPPPPPPTPPAPPRRPA